MFGSDKQIIVELLNILKEDKEETQNLFNGLRLLKNKIGISHKYLSPELNV